MTTILIIDNDGDNARLVAAYLRLKDVHTLIADSGAEGFALARQVQPDMILLALALPPRTWDGCKTSAHLLADQRTKHIPVVALRGMGEPPVRDAQHFSAVLERPFALSELDELLGWQLGSMGRAS